jgi:hypothetical protein
MDNRISAKGAIDHTGSWSPMEPPAARASARFIIRSLPASVVDLSVGNAEAQVDAIPASGRELLDIAKGL